MDFYIADSRFWSRGTTGGGTRGGFAFYQLEADGTNQITSFALDSSGNATFNYDVDISGSLGVDQSSPQGLIHIGNGSGASAYQSGNGGLTIERSGRAAINLLTPNTSDAYIFFADPQASNAAYIGYEHANDRMIFKSQDDFYFQGNNVGIGTDSPNYKLEVNGNAEFLDNVNIKSNSYDDYQIAVDSVGFSIYNRTDSAYNMTIDHTGNVGIGTIYPTSKVSISKDDNTTNDLDVLNLKRVWTSATSTDRSHGIKFSDTNATLANIYADRTNSASNYNGDLVFVTNSGASGTNTSEKMRITSAGNVGINDPTPSASLSIISNDANIIDLSRQNVGTYRLAISSTDKFSVFDVGANTDRLVIDSSGNVGIGTTAPAAKLEINGDTSIRSTNKLYFGQSTSSLGSWTTRMYANGSEHRFNANSFIFNNEGYGTTEYMRITSDGDVGIGTDNPSQKLHVYGENTVARFQSTSSYVDIYLISSGNTGFLNLSSTGLNFYAGGGSGADLKMFIGNSGNVSIADGNLIVAAGHGVDFSANQNNSGMTSELLDDYEEGTFTPTIHAGASNISLASNNYGKYTKVGNVVHCSGRFQASSLTAGSSSTNVELGGLPFTCDAPLSTGTGAVAGSIGFAGGFAGEAATMMQIRDGETNAFLYYQNSSLTVSNVKGNDLGSTTTIVFQITYQTAS
jgi:hypothetical protein